MIDVARELSIALTKLDECAMWAAAGWSSQTDGRPATLEQFLARVDELRG